MVINNWKMTYGEYGALDCVAPCSMYSVLLEKGLIKDPFYGLNELELTGLSRKGCVFEAQAEISEDMLGKEHLELVLMGIDTICDIYVNDRLLASTKNMQDRKSVV